jgi:transposase
LWRKRSLGIQSDKGVCWVERILSIKETSRIRGKTPFGVLVDLVTAYFKEQKPDLACIG